MSVLRNLERALSDVVEGTFGRLFRSEVRPVEIARKLVREMDEHVTISLSRSYAPNEYVVYLSPDDRARIADLEDDVADELCVHLLEHARAEKLTLLARPVVTFQTDKALGLGEFGIQTRTVRAAESEGPSRSAARAPGPTVQADHGQTMVYSTAGRLIEQRDGDRGPRAHPVLIIDGRRHVISGSSATIGRSRSCEVVIDDANVSRQHAELALTGDTWTIRDLGSTNGVRVDGRLLTAPAPVTHGTALELGTVSARFEVP